MIGNSLVDYINIRISITGLRLIAPASVLYLLVCAWKPQLIWTPLAVYASLEAGFYLLVYLPRKSRLQAPPSYTPPPLSPNERQTIFRKCIQSGIEHSASGLGDPNVPYPFGWFLHPKGKVNGETGEGPTRADVTDWLLWALFSTSSERIPPDVRKIYEPELDGYIKAIEDTLGYQLLLEGTRRMNSMRINLDPVLMMHRPLAWYFIVALVDAYTSYNLLRMGFQHYSPRKFEWRFTFPPRPILSLFSKRAPEGASFPYWYRPHRSKNKLPLVFIHGIGIGLYPYLPFFKTLITPHTSDPSTDEDDNDVGILLPELMSICMHMTPRSVPPRPVMLEGLNRVLEDLCERELDDEAKIKNGHGGREGEIGYDETSPLVPSSSSSTSAYSGRRYSESTIRPGEIATTTGLLNSNRNTHQAVAHPKSWSRIVLAGHSYGTFVAGWIIRDIVEREALEVSNSITVSQSSHSTTPSTTSLASKIAHMILVDPIPILLSNPTVAHNFLYRAPGSVHPILLGSHPTTSVSFTTSSTTQAGAATVTTTTTSTAAYITPTKTLEERLDELVDVVVDPPPDPSHPFSSSHSTSTQPHPLPQFAVSPKTNTPEKSYYSSAAAWQLFYFASRDADIARTLFRTFYWTEGGIWRGEVGAFVRGSTPVLSSTPSAPLFEASVDTHADRTSARTGKTGRNLAVVLGGKDQIVPSEAVRRYLTSEERWRERWVGQAVPASSSSTTQSESSSSSWGEESAFREVEISEVDGDGDNGGRLEVLFNPHLDHAVIFDDEKWTVPLVEVVGRYVREV